MIRYINSEAFHAYTKDNLELSFKLSSVEIDKFKISPSPQELSSIVMNLNPHLLVMSILFIMILLLKSLSKFAIFSPSSIFIFNYVMF